MSMGLSFLENLTLASSASPFPSLSKRVELLEKKLDKNHLKLKKPKRVKKS